MVESLTTYGAKRQQPEVADTATPGIHNAFVGYAKILANIQEKVLEKYGPARDKGHKAIYGDLMDKGEWSRKFRGRGRFTFEHIQALQKHFKAPPGWALHHVG